MLTMALPDYQAELDRQFAAYEPTPAALRIQRLVNQLTYIL
jgi:hypothetical protein